MQSTLSTNARAAITAKATLTAIACISQFYPSFAEASTINLSVQGNLAAASIGGGGTTLLISSVVAPVTNLAVGDVINITYTFQNGLGVSLTDIGPPSINEQIALDICCYSGAFNANTSLSLTGFSGDVLNSFQTGPAFGNSVLSLGSLTGNLTGSSLVFSALTGSATITAVPAGATLSNVRLFVQGDLVSTVIPIPAAVWLFGGALGLLGVMRRRISS